MTEAIPVSAETREALFPNVMARRGLKPVAVLAANRPHGDRLRYMAGCKCAECRAANSQYESMRQRARKNGDWNGIISAAKARRHIMKLSRRGVGRLALAAASDVSRTVICEIRSGRKKHIRARTERRILSVDTKAASDHALVPGRATWKLIHKMQTEGYTKNRIKKELGQAGAGLQLGKERMTVRNAWRVERVYHRLMD